MNLPSRMKNVKNIALSLSSTALLLALTACGGGAQEKPDEKPTQAAQPKEETVAVLLGDADKLAAKDQLEEALAKYQKALAKEPGNVDARLGIARVNTKLRKYEEAKTELLALYQEQPENTGVLVSLGQVHQLTGAYKEGIDLYKNVVEKNPYDSALLNQLIVLYRLNGDYKDAEQTCTRLLSRDPGNSAALKNLSLIHYDQGNYALSETIAINSLKIHDKDAALYNNRGMIRVKRQRYVEAMPFFQKAVEIDPTLTAAHLNIGSIALRFRDYETAVKHYGQAVKLEPRHLEANLGYAFSLAGQEKADDAVAQLDRVLELDGKQCDAMSEKARVLKQMKSDLQGALASAEAYVGCKGGSLAADDPMKLEIENIKNEIAAKRMAEEAMKEQAGEGAPGDG